jgi:hypothetical protein
VLAYTPPVVVAAVSPSIAGPPPVATAGTTRIEVFRGSSTDIYARPIIQREGAMTADGAPAGAGHSTLLGWRLLEGSPDGPPGRMTAPGASGGPAAPIVQQWDHPDATGPSGGRPYLLRVVCTMRTVYPDGHAEDHAFSGVVEVMVRYSASGA